MLFSVFLDDFRLKSYRRAFMRQSLMINISFVGSNFSLSSVPCLCTAVGISLTAATFRVVVILRIEVFWLWRDFLDPAVIIVLSSLNLTWLFWLGCLQEAKSLTMVAFDVLLTIFLRLCSLSCNSFCFLWKLVLSRVSLSGILLSDLAYCLSSAHCCFQI